MAAIISTVIVAHNRSAESRAGNTTDDGGLS